MRVKWDKMRAWTNTNTKLCKSEAQMPGTKTSSSKVDTNHLNQYKGWTATLLTHPKLFDPINMTPILNIWTIGPVSSHNSDQNVVLDNMSLEFICQPWIQTLSRLWLCRNVFLWRFCHIPFMAFFLAAAPFHTFECSVLTATLICCQNLSF